MCKRDGACLSIILHDLYMKDREGVSLSIILYGLCMREGTCLSIILHYLCMRALEFWLEEGYVVCMKC